MNEVQNIDRTSKGLAAAMFEELDNLRTGKSTPQAARAKSAIANTICQVSRLEMEYARFVDSSREEKNIGGLQSLPMAG